MSFPAGTLVTMADGSTRAIEQVELGEEVRDFVGDAVTVVGLEREPLGHRRVFRINEELDTTGAHPMWTNRGWGVIELDYYRQARVRPDMPITTGKGLEATRYVGVDPDKIVPFGPSRRGVLLRRQGKLVPLLVMDLNEDYPEGETFYALACDGSHTMIAQGYACSAWARDDDYDYQRKRPRK